MPAGPGVPDSPVPGNHDPAPDDRRRHDRRYKIFAAVFATIVLAFAALSIAVVVLSSSGS